jgi:MFS family permease
MVGGVVAHHYGWREAFFVAGIPGVLLAITIMLTVKEPQRIVASIQGVKAPPVPMIAVLKQILAQPAFCWLMAGNTLLFFKGGGFGSFEAVFLVQTHHLNIQQIGTVETIIGMGGLLITLLVGKVVDKLSQRDMRWFMYTAVIVSLLSVPFGLVLLLASNPWVALIVGSMGALFALSYAAPLFAAAQALVPNSMRARAIAILLLSTTLLGAGLGPPVAGLISDHLGATLGKAEGLRWSMMIMMIPGLFATFSFWRASVTLRRDAARVVGAA